MELPGNDNECSNCGSNKVNDHKKYQIKTGEERQISYCEDCKSYFSETKHTFLFRLRTEISRIILILVSLNEGQGINAVGRTFHVGKNSIYRWQERLGNLKETLLLYTLCHQFITQIVEGDELSTNVSSMSFP